MIKRKIQLAMPITGTEVFKCLRDCGDLVGLQHQVDGLAGDLRAGVDITDGPVRVVVCRVGAIQLEFGLADGSEYGAILRFLLAIMTYWPLPHEGNKLTETQDQRPGTSTNHSPSTTQRRGQSQRWTSADHP